MKTLNRDTGCLGFFIVVVVGTAPWQPLIVGIDGQAYLVGMNLLKRSQK